MRRIDAANFEKIMVKQLEKYYTDDIESSEDIPIEFDLSFFDGDVNNGDFTVSYPLNIAKPYVQSLIHEIKLRKPTIDLDVPLLACNGSYSMNFNPPKISIRCSTTNENGQYLDEYVAQNSKLQNIVETETAKIVDALSKSLKKSSTVDLLIAKNKKNHRYFK